VLIVRQQRFVGAEQAADIRRVMNADIEVGVIAHRRRQTHDAVAGWMQREPSCSLASGRQQGGELGAQGAARLCAKGEHRIQRGALGGRSRLRRRARQPRRRGGEVEDHLAIATPTRGAPPGGAKTPSGRF